MMIIGIIGAAILGFGIILYQGLVFQTLWNWFLSGVFDITLSYWLALGVLLTAKFIIQEYVPKSSYKEDKSLETLINMIALPSMSLLFGFIIYLIM